jgi:hypothetical protein
MNNPSKRLRIAVAILSLIGIVASAAWASETISYSYDARGRIITVGHSGSVNNNVVSNYSYDKADNRTNKNVTGAP